MYLLWHDFLDECESLPCFGNILDMKLDLNRIALFLGWTLVFTAFAGDTGVGAKRKTILDYYLDVPNEFIQWVDPSGAKGSDGKMFGRSRRLKAIKLKDIKNGYMELKEDDGSMGFELALFNSPDGPLMGIVKEGISVQTVTFVKLAGQNWIDVTKDVFPEIPIEDVIKRYEEKIGDQKITPTFLRQYAGSIYGVVLPRKGAVIKIRALVDEEGVYGKELFEMKFNGKKFENVR